VLDLDRMVVAVADLLWSLVREFVLTLLLCTLAGALLAYLSFLALQKAPAAAVLAVVLIILEAQTAGILLGFRRAIVMPLVRVVAQLKPGQLAIKTVFQHMGSSVFPVGSADWATRQLNRVPLAQVEQGLSRSIQELLAEPSGGFGFRSWFRRVVQERLLKGVQVITLARFRKQGAQDNTVDLEQVRQELEGNADRLLLDQLTAGIRLWTWLVILGLPLLALLQVLLLYPLAVGR
jgi:hypothetical protein